MDEMKMWMNYIHGLDKVVDDIFLDDLYFIIKFQ